MTYTAHIATIAAFERKAELGGGFRGVYFNLVTKERVESEVLPTLEAARYFAKAEAHRRHTAENYSLAPYRRRGEYKANVWVPA